MEALTYMRFYTFILISLCLCYNGQNGTGGGEENHYCDIGTSTSRKEGGRNWCESA